MKAEQREPSYLTGELESMDLCVVADLHGRCDYIPLLSSTNYDLLVICGDITSFGHKEKAREILSLFQKPYLAVHENCDHEDVLEALDEKCNLHQNVITFGDETFAGFGGSNVFAGRTPSEYTEEAIYKGLALTPENCILVTHAPPRDTAADRAFRLKHVGSKAVRRIMEEKKPKMVLCGHIHEARGIDEVGGIVVVNPGKFSEGLYAVVKTKTRKSSLEQFR